MKIIYVANIRIPTEFAHGVQVTQMCKAFTSARENVGVELVIPFRKNKVRECVWDYYGIKPTFTIRRLPCIDFVFLDFLGWIFFWIQNLSFSFFACLYLLFKKSDVVYSRDLLTVALLSLWKKNCVYEMHSRFSGLNTWFFKKIKTIIVISQGLKNELINRGVDEKKILVAPDGVDLEMFEKVEADLRRLCLDKVGNTQINADKSEFLYSDITYKIRGACFKVWKQFRGAFKEKVVERALAEELTQQGLHVETQKQIPIFYESKKVGTYVPDGIVNNKVLIELKRKPFLTKEDEKQFWLYLRGSEYKVGLLINFGRKLEIKRRVYDTARVDSPRVSACINNQRVSAYPEGQNQRVSACINNQRVSACIKKEARRKLNLPLQDFIVGYIGQLKTMGMDKGIETLLKAFQEIQKKKPRSYLCLVGGRECDIEEYKRQAGQNVVFIGHVSHQKIPFYLKSFDVLAMPFPSIPHYARDMSPLKMFEYMAANKPIITSDLPSIREVLDDDSAFFFQAEDVFSLVRSMEKIDENPEFAIKKAQNALEKVKEFTWDKRAGKIINFIR